MIEENKNCIYQNDCNHSNCDSFCLKRFKTDYYLDCGYVPQNRRFVDDLMVDTDGTDLNNFSILGGIEKDVVNFVDNAGQLYIYSSRVGNGKTYWALRILLSYVSKVYNKKELKPIVLFIGVPTYLLQLKSSISQKSEYIEDIEKWVDKVDLVVWDDIGNKEGTEFEVSHLLSIIDQRINNGKANIYTSNLNREELHEALGDRLYSRIFNSSIAIELLGKDKRGI